MVFMSGVRVFLIQVRIGFLKFYSGPDEWIVCAHEYKSKQKITWFLKIVKHSENGSLLVLQKST